STTKFTAGVILSEAKDLFEGDPSPPTRLRMTHSPPTRLRMTHSPPTRLRMTHSPPTRLRMTHSPPTRLRMTHSPPTRLRMTHSPHQSCLHFDRRRLQGLRQRTAIFGRRCLCVKHVLVDVRHLGLAVELDFRDLEAGADLV